MANVTCKRCGERESAYMLTVLESSSVESVCKQCLAGVVSGTPAPEHPSECEMCGDEPVAFILRNAVGDEPDAYGPACFVAFCRNVLDSVPDVSVIVKAECGSEVWDALQAFLEVPPEPLHSVPDEPAEDEQPSANGSAELLPPGLAKAATKRTRARKTTTPASSK